MRPPSPDRGGRGRVSRPFGCVEARFPSRAWEDSRARWLACPGCVIRVKIIALFKMRDDNGPDHKALCVPLSDPALRRPRRGGRPAGNLQVGWERDRREQAAVNSSPPLSSDGVGAQRPSDPPGGGGTRRQARPVPLSGGTAHAPADQRLDQPRGWVVAWHLAGVRLDDVEGVGDQATGVAVGVAAA